MIEKLTSCLAEVLIYILTKNTYLDMTDYLIVNTKAVCKIKYTILIYSILIYRLLVPMSDVHHHNSWDLLFSLATKFRVSQ